MQLLDSTHQPSPSAEIVCRQSRTGNAVAALVWFAILIVAPTAGWSLGVINTTILVLIGCVTVPLTLGLSSITRAAFLPTNWQLSIEPDGLRINLRSYRNADLPPGATVVDIPYGQVLSVRQHVAWMNAPSSDSTVSWREKSLDIEVTQADAELIRVAVAEERNRRTERGYLGNFITVKGRANHVPVTVVNAHVVRVFWRSRFDSIRPSLNHVLSRLQYRVRQIDPPTRESVREWDQLADHDFDDLLLRLIEENDTITAVSMLKQRRNYTTTEAKRFVDEVTGQLATETLVD